MNFFNFGQSSSTSTHQQQQPTFQGSGMISGQLNEWIYGPDANSAEGKQRTENQRARDHATNERLGSEDFNSREARINREWQEYMSNTSYQRAVKDMESAGINPFFAVNQGGASTPAGGSARSSASPSSASQTKNSDPFGKILGLVGTVLTAVQTGAKISSLQNATVDKLAFQKEALEQKLASASKLSTLKNDTLQSMNLAKIKSNEKLANKRDRYEETHYDRYGIPYWSKIRNYKKKD